MRCLVLASFDDVGQAKRFDAFLDSAVSLVYAGAAPEVDRLGTFARAARGRGSEEMLHVTSLAFSTGAQRVESPQVAAQEFEAVLRSMAVAVALTGCEIKVLAAIK